MVSRTKQRTATVPTVAALPVLLSACSGSQSTLAPASRAAALVAELWWVMLIVASLVVLLVLGLLLTGIFRSRGDRPPRPLNVRKSRNLVIAGGVILPLSVTIPFILSSFAIGRVADAPAPDGALTVEVIGRLWWWEIHYLDDVGRRIATTANEIHVPVGQPVRFILKSDNVIHSFWVPNLLGKVDMIPGRQNVASLTADRAGVYRGQCAEYCGQQHALMGFLLIAQPEEKFDAWLQHQQEPAAVPDTPEGLRGREVFLEASCGECHTIRGTAAGGTQGPDLTHIGSRRTLAAATVPNTIGHLGGWISDPQRIKPQSQMPPTFLPPADLKALIRYLEGLE